MAVSDQVDVLGDLRNDVRALALSSIYRRRMT